MLNILVLCTGNSARSILLEHLLSQRSEGRVRAFSAGSQPAGVVHPYSLQLLATKGFDTDAARSKSWDEFALSDAPEMDAVITVCGSAADEICPIWPGVPVRAHWGVEDPAKAAQADWPTAFNAAYDALQNRAEAFLALPFENYDSAALQLAIMKIGKFDDV
jgi:arsenate reductase